jgi:energy-coupling factor transport system permease protein
MQELELRRYITIGQYLPSGSVLHRLDPRTKILGIGALLMAIVFSRSLTGLFFALVCILGLIAIARVPMDLALGGLRPTLPVLLFIAFLQLLFGWGALTSASCQVLWSGWIIKITNCSFLSVISMILRLVSMFLLIGLLTMTSTISELTHGIESLLYPFRRLGLPAHDLAMVFTIALRFVPTLADELEKLLKAQISRGADIRLGSNPVQRVRHFLPVLVPLFLVTLRRGDTLVEAMEARGYTVSLDRTRFVRLKMSPNDFLALAMVAVLVGGLFLFPFQVFDNTLLSLISKAAGY